jgi:L-ascorbate metabolism protein UlaG (beta-lactamase superfamily)
MAMFLSPGEMDKAVKKRYSFKAMDVIWNGYSCFQIKEKNSLVITDPYKLDNTIPQPFLKANIITISHPHQDNYFTDDSDSNPTIIAIPGEYERAGIFVTGIATFRDNENGTLNGKNTVFVIEFGNMTLCHLGDLGHRLPSQLLEDVGTVDILFLPIGGNESFTVDLAVETIRAIEPRVVIPMGYAPVSTSSSPDTLSNFLKKSGAHNTEAKPKLTVTQSSLPSNTEVVVLSNDT